MTKSEAIEAIKANYPPENYTILREALDMAIAELSKKDDISRILNCSSTYTDRNFKCLGYTYANDEPLDICKNCSKHVEYGVE